MDEINRKSEELLRKIQFEESHRGRLRVFFGFAAGVGKTYAMLSEAHELMLMGKSVVIGYVEPHNRPETNRLVEGLPKVPAKKFQYKQLTLYEPNIDRVIELAPDIVLIDELAHSNAEGSRNKKRYQDVEELLNAGINVFTTINVQHVESLNDIVEGVTGIEVKETVPDTFFTHAVLKVIDVEPNELIERLEHGKIYANENAKRALRNFFVPEKLDQLRGLAIQRASDHINRFHSKTNGIQSKLLTIIEDTYPKMAEKCIRWTSRLAQGLGAEWIVIQIRSLENTATTVPLAEKLGAEVISIEAEDSFETIVEYSKMVGATDIIMGKNLTKKWYQKVFNESFEDRLIKRLNETEIHLIPYKEVKKRPRFSVQKVIEGDRKDLMIALGGVVGSTFLTGVLQTLHVGSQNLMLVYIFFVLMIARLTSGYFWSALSSILGVLAFNWFFVEPLYSLTVYKEGYPITLLIMLIVSLMISNLMVRLKTRALTSKEKEQQMEILYELNKQYMLAATNQQIFDITTTYLSRLLDRDIVTYDRTGVKRSLSKMTSESSLDSTEESAVAFWAVKNQKEAGNGTDTLSGAQGFYLPIVLEGKSLGALGVERNPEQKLENSQLNYLKLVITQLAIVLEQSYLKDEKERIQIENERERVRSNLLRAISHDLRTPLTAISGIAETLSDDELELEQETKKKLLRDIQEESQWLIRMVENLLSITRINIDTMKVKKTSESLEEIIAAVLSRLKKVYPAQKISVSLPEEMIFVEVDPILIEQALFNLLENAVRHGDKEQPVTLNIKKSEGKVYFEIINYGEIPVAQFQKLQNNLVMDEEAPVDSKNGLGIGLSIVKTIIHAHNGKMEIETNEGKTVVRFYLQ